MAATIRPMTPADLEPAAAAVLAGGWGDRRAWFEFALDHRECEPIVAAEDGAILGTGCATRNGMVGWVGTIFVIPERRGEGIGLALSATVCERLESAGCRSLVLVATEMGRPVYEKLGFEEDGWYRTFEAPGTGPAATGLAGAGADEAAAIGARAILPFGPDDVAEAATLDLAATGEDRRHLLATFATIPGGLALRGPDGGLRGFVCRAPWGGGATVAATVEDVEPLLAARRARVEAGHPVRAGILEANEAGLRRLPELGWTEVYRVVRMRRGDPLDWHPERIWGQFSFAVG